MCDGVGLTVDRWGSGWTIVLSRMYVCMDVCTWIGWADGWVDGWTEREENGRCDVTFEARGGR